MLGNSQQYIKSLQLMLCEQAPPELPVQNGEARATQEEELLETPL
jgi:hypothetical protein